MAVERYGSKTDVVVKLVLVFFISLLSFSIGTFVGKKFSDNQHKLAQFEPTHQEADREIASVPHDSTEVKPKDALTDDEIAKLAEEFVSDDEGKGAHGKVADSHAAPAAKADPHAAPAAKADPHAVPAKAPVAKADPHAAPAAKADPHAAPAKAPVAKADPHAAPAAKADPHAAPAAKADTHAAPATVAHSAKKADHKPASTHEPEHAPSVAAEKVMKGLPPSEPKANSAPAERIPQSLPKQVAASSLGKFTVQVASYPSEGEAQKMAGDLKSKGFSAFYVPAKVKDKTWYRVSVGLFTTSKEAESYKGDLMARGNITTAIVQKISQ